VPYHYTRRTRETAADRRKLWDICQQLTGLAPSRGTAAGL